MVEAISVTCAMRKSRNHTLFSEESYIKEGHLQEVEQKDGPYKKSPYYIREKIELGIIA